VSLLFNCQWLTYPEVKAAVASLSFNYRYLKFPDHEINFDPLCNYNFPYSSFWSTGSLQGCAIPSSKTFCGNNRHGSHPGQMQFG